MPPVSGWLAHTPQLVPELAQTHWAPAPEPQILL
jgi:hypothetical protein